MNFKGKNASVIIPVFQNSQSLHDTYSKVCSVLEKIFLTQKVNYKIYFIDDGSNDGSLDILKNFSRSNQRVQVIKFTKNFGQINALMAGLRACQEDCAIMISADLQDPPELIEKMIEYWLTGSKFIFAERTDRPERGLSAIFSKIFWNMVKQYALPGYPAGGFDFCLIDRELINIVANSHEKNTHIFPLLFYLGFRPTRIPYKRQVREAGKSQWTFSKKIKLALDTFIGFSFLPIRFITIMGLIISMLSLLFSIYALLNYVIVGNPYTGWTSLAIISSFIGGITLVSLGIISEYLWRILEQIRPRPGYVVEEVIIQNEK